jgi:hypothetical protein
MIKYIMAGSLLFISRLLDAQVIPVAETYVTTNQTIPANQLPKNGVNGLITSQTFTPAIINNLCPKTRLRGDNDFEGHKVAVSVNIYYTGYTSGRDNVIKAVIELSGEEQEEDREGEIRAYVKGKWEKEIYRAPEGYLIAGMEGEKSVSFSFIADPSRKGSSQVIDGCKGNFFRLSNGTFGLGFEHKILLDMLLSTDFAGDDFNGEKLACDNCCFKIRALSLKSFTVNLKKG